jgi:hypothetical protein
MFLFERNRLLAPCLPAALLLSAAFTLSTYGMPSIERHSKALVRARWLVIINDMTSEYKMEDDARATWATILADDHSMRKFPGLIIEKKNKFYKLEPKTKIHKAEIVKTGKPAHFFEYSVDQLMLQGLSDSTQSCLYGKSEVAIAQATMEDYFKQCEAEDKLPYDQTLKGESDSLRKLCEEIEHRESSSPNETNTEQTNTEQTNTEQTNTEQANAEQTNPEPTNPEQTSTLDNTGSVEVIMNVLSLVEGFLGLEIVTNEMSPFGAHPGHDRDWLTLNVKPNGPVRIWPKDLPHSVLVTAMSIFDKDENNGGYKPNKDLPEVIDSTWRKYLQRKVEFNNFILCPTNGGISYRFGVPYREQSARGTVDIVDVRGRSLLIARDEKNRDDFVKLHPKFLPWKKLNFYTVAPDQSAVVYSQRGQLFWKNLDSSMRLLGRIREVNGVQWVNETEVAYDSGSRAWLMRSGF